MYDDAIVQCETSTSLGLAMALAVGPKGTTPTVRSFSLLLLPLDLPLLVLSGTAIYSDFRMSNVKVTGPYVDARITQDAKVRVAICHTSFVNETFIIAPSCPSREPHHNHAKM